MLRWRTTVIVGTLVLVAGVAGVLIYRETFPNDPVYKGKRLSQHLERVNGGLFLGGMNIDASGEYPNVPAPPRVHYDGYPSAEVREAIAMEGTNAIPMLLRMLRSKDLPYRTWLHELAYKHALVAILIRPKGPQAFANQVRAAAAFDMLGASAADAAPQVVPLLHDPDTALAALVVLAAIRPTRVEDILAITNVLGIQKLPSNMGPPGLLHAAALLTLASFGEQAEGATPILMKSLSSTDRYVRAAAAVALARMRAEPEKVVPQIMNEVADLSVGPGIPSTNGFGPPMRLEEESCLELNVWALGEYGQAARPALTVLSNVQSYPVMNIQRLAADTCTKIRSATNALAGPSNPLNN
jgi:hypothetical protein